MNTDNPISNPNVVLREEFDDWAVLFNPDTTGAVGINPVGILLWKQMDGSRTIGQLAAEVRVTFGMVPDSAEAEIRSFVDDLAKKGFVGFDVSAENQ